jgi:integrase
MIKDFAQKYQISTDIINKLYNPNRKIDFIEEQYGGNQSNKSIEVKTSFFKNIGDIEKQKGKDLMEFNIIEIESIFKTLKIAVKSSFNNRKNIIRKYFEWGIQKGYINFDRIILFDNLTFDHIFDDNNLKNKYFKDINDLIKCLNIIVSTYTPYDRHRYDTIICAILLIWCGMSINDICCLKIESIDFKSKTIKLDKDYKLPEYVNNFIIDYLNTTSYTGNQKAKLGKVYLYKDTGYVLRVTTNSSILCYSKAGLQSTISNWFNKGITQIAENNRYFGHSLYLKDVYDSGFFNRLYEYENQYNIKVRDLDDKIFLNLRHINNISEQKKGKLIETYQLWKQTFYGI